MNVIVVGADFRIGDFVPEGKKERVDYSNLFLTALYKNEYKDGKNIGFGYSAVCEKIKFNKENMERLFGCVLSVDDVDSMREHHYEFSYNNKGVLCGIYPIDPPDQPSSRKKGE